MMKLRLSEAAFALVVDVISSSAAGTHFDACHMAFSLLPSATNRLWLAKLSASNSAH
jgi:hypothetical protein